MYLIADTETTGFPSDSRTASDPLQAHICQLGALLISSNNRVVGELNVLIKPRGWTIHPEVTKIHGITNEMCEEYGVPLRLAIYQFEEFVRKAKLFVAHNLIFDQKMLKLAHQILQEEEPGFNSRLDSLEQFCTMRATTDICKLPKARGAGYKWPKLTEAYFHFFNEELDCAHDAMADVRGCGKIYFELLRRSTFQQGEGSTETIQESPI